MPPLASSLTATGCLWALLSLAASLVSAVGFYLPFWMSGRLADGTEVSFGSFRRCNYPRLEGGSLVMVRECGRYTSFGDIPSGSWRAATVAVGLGAALAMLSAFTALSACCLADVITKATARVLGLVQLVAAVLLSTGCCIYPNGWSSREVRDVCGPESDAYRLGSCQISWSLWLLCFSACALVACTVLSLRASRVKPNSFRIWQQNPAHPQQSFEMQIQHMDEEDIATITRGNSWQRAEGSSAPKKPGRVLLLKGSGNPKKTKLEKKLDECSLWMASLWTAYPPLILSTSALRRESSAYPVDLLLRWHFCTLSPWARKHLRDAFNNLSAAILVR